MRSILLIFGTLLSLCIAVEELRPVADLTRNLCRVAESPAVVGFPRHVPSVWSSLSDAIERAELDPEGMFNVLDGFRQCLMIAEALLEDACGEDLLLQQDTESMRARVASMRSLYNRILGRESKLVYCTIQECTLAQALKKLAALEVQVPEFFADTMPNLAFRLELDTKDRFGAIAPGMTVEQLSQPWTLHLSEDVTYSPRITLWSQFIDYVQWGRN